MNVYISEHIHTRCTLNKTSLARFLHERFPMKDDFEVFELIVKKGTFKEHLELKEDFFFQ